MQSDLAQQKALEVQLHTQQTSARLPSLQT
jgi:hypothetical protein